MTRFVSRDRAEDIEGIMRVEDASFAPGIRESRETFEDRIDSCPGCITVLSDGHDGPIYGYLTAEIWDRVPEPTTESYRLGHAASERHVERGTVLYVSSFAVEPARRGGIGRPFFRESLALIAKNHHALERVAFIVHEDWLAARRIYESEGFSYAAEIAGFFGPEGKSALVMEKSL